MGGFFFLLYASPDELETSVTRDWMQDVQHRHVARTRPVNDFDDHGRKGLDDLHDKAFRESRDSQSFSSCERWQISISLPSTGYAILSCNLARRVCASKAVVSADDTTTAYVSINWTGEGLHPSVATYVAIFAVAKRMVWELIWH